MYRKNKNYDKTMIILGIFGQWIGLKNVGVDVYSVWKQWDAVRWRFFQKFFRKVNQLPFVIIRFSFSIEC